MKAPETVLKFIEFGALGWSFVRIAEQFPSPSPPSSRIPIAYRFSYRFWTGFPPRAALLVGPAA
jgi:hypothetical protein